ncbi:glycoside hydrolase [Aspergillus taichungensis]|uniref:Lysozyme n=1 Tax=Aspergillus taichungensis TaxID=482145 RepID=A0A2J5HWT9_9EURO|nr:glycoside hydrolase [Aspergillus taichungensis]
MKFNALSVSATLAGLASAGPLAARADGVQGFDISHYQESVDFQGAYDAGARFVIIKATEGLDYVDSSFSSHYQGATDAKIARGAYHFAHPDISSAKEQVDYFIKNGGGWSDDGITLPGMLDIEFNPNGDNCFGLTPDQMVAWANEFADEYKTQTGVYPLVYTNGGWWAECAGEGGGLGSKSPLVLAAYTESAPTTIPGDWETYTIWQYNDSYEFGGDSDILNGGEDVLKKLIAG